MIVTFIETETRDALKSYASGLTSCQGAAGLRLELTDNLRGSCRVLEEHGYAVKDLYGKETKRNIKFDDRNRDLMMDIKLAGSTKWHNITIEQAHRAKKIREDLEMTKLSQGRPVAGLSADR